MAVIAPPYFALDEEELLAHFVAAAAACAPVPFYLYEFEARSGYAIPVAVVERLREQAPNLAGLKVSDSPWDKVAPYLLEGLDVFVGAEGLLVEGLAAGAAGAVSGLAASFPDAVVPLVRAPSPELGEKAAALRASLSRLPFHAASKTALGLRGVPVTAEVCAPLRGLTEAEQARARADRARLAARERAPQPDPRGGGQPAPAALRAAVRLPARRRALRGRREPRRRPSRSCGG